MLIGRAAWRVGLADHLAHLQSAAGQEQRRQVAIVVAAAVLVDPRRAAHFAGDDQQNLVAQAALANVVEKARHGVIHLARPSARTPAMPRGLLPLACMSQPQSETVTKPQPASHSRRASSICLPSRLVVRRMSFQTCRSCIRNSWLVS